MQGFLPGLAYPPAFRLTLDGRRPMLHGSYLLSIELDGRRSEHSRVFFFRSSAGYDARHVRPSDQATGPLSRCPEAYISQHTERVCREFRHRCEWRACISVGLRGIRKQRTGKEKKRLKQSCVDIGCVDTSRTDRSVGSTRRIARTLYSCGLSTRTTAL